MSFKPKFKRAFYPASNPYKEREEEPEEFKKLTIYKRETIKEKVNNHGVGPKQPE